MTQYLLDTHVVLWAFGSPDSLAPSIRVAIQDPRNTIVVSAASVWEVEIKRALGKLTAPSGFAATCIQRGFDALAISFEHAEVAGALPLHHGDPFDRMLIAQAMVEDLEIISDDRVFEQYPVRVAPATV